MEEAWQTKTGCQWKLWALPLAVTYKIRATGTTASAKEPYFTLNHSTDEHPRDSDWDHLPYRTVYTPPPPTQQNLHKDYSRGHSSHFVFKPNFTINGVCPKRIAMYPQAQKLSNSFKESTAVQALSNVHPENLFINGLFSGLAPLPSVSWMHYTAWRDMSKTNMLCVK